MWRNITVITTFVTLNNWVMWVLVLIDLDLAVRGIPFMLSFIWLALVISSIAFGLYDGHITDVVNSVADSAKLSVQVAIGLTGIMAFWLGLMKIAEAGGLVNVLARLLRPVLVRLFPEVPADHPAMGAIVMNIAANMLGLGNAATPFGVRAMEQMQSLNQFPSAASNAMCTFLAINTSSVQLVPVTAIAFLAAAGATQPTAIIATSLFATTCSTIAGISAVKVLQRWSIFRIRGER